MKKELLDEIAIKANIGYLSDLHMYAYRKQVCSAVESIKVESYLVTEWQKAISYVMQEPVKVFATPEEAKGYLLKRLYE